VYELRTMMVWSRRISCGGVCQIKSCKALSTMFLQRKSASSLGGLPPSGKVVRD